MTPPKRRPATPSSQGPKKAAPRPKVPDVPTAPPVRTQPPTPGGVRAPDELVTAPVPPAETKDGAQLLGPEGEPIAQEAPRGDARGDSAAPRKTAQVAAEDRATTQSPGRRRTWYPLPVWPD